jgi:hypothetical protein
MATFYMDLIGGNDANDGTSFANRWKTFASGATAARTAPGDTIRIMASPNETLVGNATWTNASRTVTLASAVTATICNCDDNWSVPADVISGPYTTSYKDGTQAIYCSIQPDFTTGLAAYFATGTLDLSAYQQVSFWANSNSFINAGNLSLRLCSDTSGLTSVHTIPIPFFTSISKWVPITVDLGTNLSSSINSIALYCEVDTGSVEIRLDNIIACKASSSADALTLNSLIGKVHNLSWLASTTYAVNDIRRPTQPNRNGYKYQVTAQTGATGSSEPAWPQGIGQSVIDGGVTWLCEGLEDTWYAIASINGTSVTLDGDVNALPSATAYGYPHATGTVATYKREPLAQGQLSSSSNTFNGVQESGTSTQSIVYSGGWNRTDMSTQTGETWITGGNGLGVAFYGNNMDYITVENFNSVRYSYGFYFLRTSWQHKNCHHNNATNGLVLSLSFNTLILRNVITSMCSGVGMDFSQGGGYFDALAIQANGNNAAGFVTSSSNGALCGPPVRDIWAKGNATYGLNHLSVRELSLTGFVASGNGTACLAASGGCTRVNLVNSLLSGTEFVDPPDFRGTYIYSQKHDQTAGNHLIWTDGGSIISATDQRHTASGISWKFRPTSTNHTSDYPLHLSVAKVAVLANSLVTIAIWTRRDNSNIAGQLLVQGGQIAGVPSDVSVSCAPSINTWTQSGNLTFTPSESGVVEVLFQVWDGVGTSNNFWIDDISITQA